MTFHKGRGLARVRLNGRDIYLGPWGSREAKAAYDRTIAEWLANGRTTPPPSGRAVEAASTGEVTVAQLVLAYANEHEPKFADPRVWKGTVAPALRRLRWLYGDVPAAELTPARFETFLKWCANGCGGKAEPLSRKYVNSRIGPRVKRLYRWGTRRGMVAAATWQALLAVEGLERGDAYELAPVRPVDDATVNATLPHLSPVVADMIALQRATGARPGEICAITWGQIDTSGEVWTYKPAKHKNSHRGMDRHIHLGPRAQGLLLKYRVRPADAAIFSPFEAEMQRRAMLRAERVSKVPPSQQDRAERGVESLQRRCRPFYTAQSYGLAIRRACARAFPPPAGLSADERKAWVKEHTWSPNRLRHTRATELRREFGLDVAGAVLGHSRLETTQVYAEMAAEKSFEAARRSG